MQTNNRAELTALLKALEYVAIHRLKDVEILSDSELVVNGIAGKAKWKANRDLCDSIEALFAALHGKVAFKIRHIPRKLNKADHKAKQAAASLV